MARRPKRDYEKLMRDKIYQSYGLYLFTSNHAKNGAKSKMANKKDRYSNLLITAKFVVSRRAFCKLRRDFPFFCSSSHLICGGVNADHSVTRSPSFSRKNKTDNDYGLFKNSEGNHGGDWNLFCRGKEPDIALLLQVG